MEKQLIDVLSRYQKELEKFVEIEVVNVQGMIDEISDVIFDLENAMEDKIKTQLKIEIMDEWGYSEEDYEDNEDEVMREVDDRFDDIKEKNM